MGKLTFKITTLDYEDHRAFGPDHIFAKLANSQLRNRFPVLTEADLRIGRSTRFIDRAGLTDSLKAYNEAIGNPLSDNTCSALRNSGGLIVSGQQVGLLLGPLYTFLKLVTIVGLTRKLQDRADFPLLPSFWLASEDHDVLEVNRCMIGDREFTCPYEGKMSSGQIPPVGEISIQDCRENLLGFLGQCLPQNEFREWLLDIVSGSDFSSYSRLFATLLSKLFREYSIVMIDALDLRSRNGEILAAIVAKWPRLSKALETGKTTLRNSGIKPPINAIQLFELRNGARSKCRVTDQGISINDKMAPFTEAAKYVRAHPSEFSSGAALRPLVQDATLPVTAYIAGPSETAYLWEIDPLYRVLGINRSKIVPRISATFIERKIVRTALKLGIAPDQLLRSNEVIPPQWSALKEESDLQRLDELGRQLMIHIQELPERKAERWIEKAEQSIGYQLERIVTKTKEKRLNDLGQGRQQLTKVENSLFPQGHLQERIQNLFYFLGQYGPDFIGQAIRSLNPEVIQHQIATLEIPEGDEAA